MDLDDDVLELIDDYVAKALGVTGTRKPTPAPRVLTPLPPEAAPDSSGVSAVDMSAVDVSEIEALIEAAQAELGDEDDDMIPIEVDLGTSGNPFAREEQTAWMAPPFAPASDGIPVLSRIRAPRGSTPPPDLEDDEITNIIKKPTP